VRPFPLTTLNGGINRLKVKGGALASRLYDLQNAYITNEGTIVPREGTARSATLTSQTIGLAAANGTFNVFAPNSGFQPLTQNAIVSTTTGGDGTFVSGTTYYFEVTAVDAYGGQTIVSNEQHLIATGAACTLTVSWLQTPGALSYNVYYGTGAGLENKVLNVGTALNLLATSTSLFAAGSPPGVNTTLITVPTGYTLNILSDPHDRTQLLKIIWFAKPFMGFEFVVAQFVNGDIVHYWLQNSGTWTTGADYTTASIVLPPTLNGLAYQAVRHFPIEPLWTPNTVITSGKYVEPNSPTGFAYQAVAVAGVLVTQAVTGAIEPVWPTVAGAEIQEFGNIDATSSVSNGSQVSGATISTTGPLSNQITDRYGDSNTISNAGIFATGSVLSTLTLASTKVKTWTAGTTYPTGSVVVPTTNQGGFVNAIPNGDFESGAIDWTFTDIGGAGAWAIGTTRPYSGTYDVEIAGGTSFGADGAYATMTTGAAVNPGQSVTLTGQLNPNNNGADLELWLALRWYTAGSTFISNTLSAPAEGSNYRPVSVTGIAPANAAFCKAAVRAGAGTTSRNMGFADNLSWNLASPSALSNFLFEAVQPTTGISGSTEPSWPTVALSEVVDNSVTWQAIGTSIITWQAIPLMQAGANVPVFPTTIGNSVYDSSTFTNINGYITTFTSMSWLAADRSVSDIKDPDTIPVTIGASHIFAGDNDIVDYSAAVNPLDWTSTNNAGYLPTGLNNYGDQPVAALALYRGNLVAFNAGGYQMWQIDPDPQNMAFLDAQPVGSIFPRAAQSVANDLIFLTEVGVRNLGTIGATANMAIGNTGQPVDPLIMAQVTGVPIYNVPGASDPYFADVGALLFMNGSNGSTSFTDSGPGGVTVTNVNGVTQTNANTPIFETTSAFFASTGFPSTDMYLSLPIVPGGPLDLSTGDYTIEGWIYGHSQDGSGGGAAGTFLSDGAGVFTPGPNQLLFNAASKDIEGAAISMFNGAYITSANVILNQWQSFAFVRSGSTTTAYLNGVAGTPVASTFTVTTGSWHIGSALRSEPFWGWLSNIRFTKGVARYTSNYTPSAPLGSPVSYVTVPNNQSQYPLSFYYPGRGQYWLVFGPQAFVLTINGLQGTKSWSRYIFPQNITDATLNSGSLFLRTSGNLVWRLDNTSLYDDNSTTIATASPVAFNGVAQWPYLDMGALGLNKGLIGVDIVGDGGCIVQVAFDQQDDTTFVDNPNFTVSTGVTPPYFVAIDDTVPGEPLPIPINAPSYSLILTFPSVISTTGATNPWTWEAANFYLAPAGGGGVTG
jgi:hypothetical protein